MKLWKFLLFFFLFALATSLFVRISTDGFKEGNVAVISIKGVITNERVLFETNAVSDDILLLIDQAEEDPQIKAVVFEIESPGGYVVPSEEIANKIKTMKKPTVAVIRNVGASGAYWIASATDYVIASKVSITGSIGVQSSYLDFAGLMRRYNVTYNRLTGGEYKDMGSPFKELSEDERVKLAKKINMIHQYFANEVAANRNISSEKMQEIATGEFYLGVEALELGLIDQIGNMDTAKKYLEEKLGKSVSYQYYNKYKPSLKELFTARLFSSSPVSNLEIKVQ
ncbi:MAG: signal peptide peptidase SppA [Candidatus Woesearchaeota archaeon]